MPWTVEKARAFAEHHIAVWNSHDLERILDLYTEDVELTSPFAEKVVGSPVVRGRAALREYFGKALAANPDLRFELFEALHSLDSVIVSMRGVGGRLVADVLVIDESGQIAKVFAHYGRQLAT